MDVLECVIGVMWVGVSILGCLFTVGVGITAVGILFNPKLYSSVVLGSYCNFAFISVILAFFSGVLGVTLDIMGDNFVVLLVPAWVVAMAFAVMAINGFIFRFLNKWYLSTQEKEKAEAKAAEEAERARQEAEQKEYQRRIADCDKLLEKYSQEIAKMAEDVTEQALFEDVFADLLAERFLAEFDPFVDK